MVKRHTVDRLFSAVREILFQEWDPIGVSHFASWPEDEYDATPAPSAGGSPKGPTRPRSPNTSTAVRPSTWACPRWTRNDTAGSPDASAVSYRNRGEHPAGRAM